MVLAQVRANELGASATQSVQASLFPFLRCCWQAASRPGRHIDADPVLHVA